MLLWVNSLYGLIAQYTDLEIGLLLSQRLNFKAWNVYPSHIHAFNFKTAQKQKFPMFIEGSGRQTVGLGPIVGCLALFVGPHNIVYVVANCVS